MLEISGYSACPANATRQVKEMVNFVAHSESTLGVLEILDHFQSRFVT